MKQLFLALVTLLSVQVFAQQAQPPHVFDFGVVHQLYSTELSEIRTLNIYLPLEYKLDSLKQFPVIYLLDGSAHEDYPHIAGLSRFLTMYELMNPAVIVGIANVDRKRDFTFPTTIAADKEKLPTTGGSEKFIRFLEMELLPYVSKNFRVTANKTIIGQSLGGLVATEILFKKTALFDNYIIVSPSLWWDKQSLLKQGADLLAANSGARKKIYVGVGGREHRIMRRDARALARLLKRKLPASVITFEELKKETHATVLHRSAYSALVWMNQQKLVK